MPRYFHAVLKWPEITISLPNCHILLGYEQITRYYLSLTKWPDITRFWPNDQRLPGNNRVTRDYQVITKRQRTTCDQMTRDYQFVTKSLEIIMLGQMTIDYHVVTKLPVITMCSQIALLWPHDQRLPGCDQISRDYQSFTKWPEITKRVFSPGKCSGAAPGVSHSWSSSRDHRARLVSLHRAFLLFHFHRFFIGMFFQVITIQL